jgi:hypothetical protein
MVQCPICNVPIDFHKAGPCLDSWLAKMIFSQEVNSVEDSTGSIRPDVPAFSTDMASAWLIIQKLCSESGNSYADIVYREGQFGVRFDPDIKLTWSNQDALAISRAAIKAASMRIASLV